MFSPHQETLIVDMVCENNAIKLSEIQQKIIEDHVHFEGINSVSLSTVDHVLKRNRLRTSYTECPLIATQTESKSKDSSMYRLAYIQTHSMLITLSSDLL